MHRLSINRARARVEIPHHPPLLTTVPPPPPPPPPSPPPPSPPPPSPPPPSPTLVHSATANEEQQQCPSIVKY
ncbi:hypothetical protein V494_08130 [Pseudogymnoascus sp. VKM F-4513 (FW-928)]|nr:hypothetical protein V494_08130 [Pseudogymnoascus sp. VKM F-4513 (FW-928)]